MSDEQIEEQPEEQPSLAEWLEGVFGGTDHGIVACDGFDDCIVGATEGFGGYYRLVYDRSKMVQKLMDRDGMTEEEAIEFFDFNIVGAYTSHQDPIYLVASAPKLRESIQEEA